jgi:hypothetical protein
MEIISQTTTEHKLKPNFIISLPYNWNQSCMIFLKKISKIFACPVHKSKVRKQIRYRIRIAILIYRIKYSLSNKRKLCKEIEIEIQYQIV